MRCTAIRVGWAWAGCICVAVLIVNLATRAALAQAPKPREGTPSRGGKEQSSSGKGQLPDLTPRRFDAGQSPSVARSKLSDQELAALGIRKISGKHLTLFTDLPAEKTVDELPQVFDKAVPQWCAYFQILSERTVSWTAAGCLIKDKDRFLRAGLLPTDLPPFRNGYQRGTDLWVYEQSSPYYRRHLLLHEGTHAFMNAILGGSGPPWYMEGIAELLATHRWQDGKLELNYFPATKMEVLDWARIKIVRDGFRDGKAKTFDEILSYDSQAHLQVEPYGWCWGLAAFLDGHPLYQSRFHQLRNQVHDRTSAFSQHFQESVGSDLAHLVREWQWYVANVDYGYDIAREAIEPRKVMTLPTTGAEVQIAADRGWQSTGFRLDAGQNFRVEAAGRYQLGNDPKPWWCEPNGVTIRYFHGRPLGMVLGAIVDESEGNSSPNGFLTPAAIGESLETTLRRSGTLYVRINDSPAELADNQGHVTVRITRLP